MVILDDEHFGDTIIAGNKVLSRNKFLEIRESVLTYFHIGGSKYRI